MRKKVLILGHSEATQFIDIYNQYTRLFDQNKYEVTIACLTGALEEETKKRLIAEKIIFFNFHKKTTRGLKIGMIRKLLSLCRQEKFHIVICHRYKPTYLMMWVAQFCKIPALVFVMHELKTMSSINRQLLIACLYRKNMLFAGVSNAVRDDMRNHLRKIPQQSIVTLYNMIDIELTEPQFLSRNEARKTLSLAEESFVFGHIARLAPNKDQKNLIHAFSLIQSHCPHAKLVIMGDGLLEASLKEQIISYGLEQEVLLTGYVSTAFRYMKAFDCFVLSSIQEAFGRVLLEAMIAKIPVIATNVHGIPEVVGEAGVLIPAQDSFSLSEAMKNIYHLEQYELNQKGEKGYQHIHTHFSIPQFQSQFWQHPLLQGIMHENSLCHNI